MGIRAAFTFAIRAIARPSVFLAAAAIAMIALLTPPAIEDASAQGFRMQGSRGGFSGGGNRARGNPSMSRGMSQKANYSGRQGGRGGAANNSHYSNRGGRSGGRGSTNLHPKNNGRPGGTASTNNYPKNGGRPGRPNGTASNNNHPTYGGRPGRPGRPGGSANTNNYPNTNNRPNSGMGTDSGRYPKRHPGSTADTSYPKGDHRNPRWPQRPRTIDVRPPVVIATPGGIPTGPSRPNQVRTPTTVALPPAPPPRTPSNVSSGGGGRGGSGQLPPAPPGNQPPPTNWGRYVPNEVVVELGSNVPQQFIGAMLQRHRLTQLEAINLQATNTSILRLRINDRRPVPAVVRALAAEGFNVQPNLIASLQEASTAPASESDLDQYALARMRMPEAHTLANGHRVLIAVIDGGVDVGHPELAGLILDTYDAIGTGDRMHPHGTSIVGAIAARARLRGTAPGAHILVARAFGTRRNNMDGTTIDIIKAIEWSVQRGARIINMSFAGERDPAIERRLTFARGRGIILVAASGNAGPNSRPLYPAANPAVIAVTATDEDDGLYRSAVRGNHIAIAAPGVNLLLPTVGGDYRMTSGTSFSAAEITGVIALMLERDPNLDPDAVRRILIRTARDLGAPGLDPLFGAGLVDAYQAVMSVMPAGPAADAAPTSAGVGQ